MSDLLIEIVTLLTDGLSAMATGIGEGLSNLVQGIFVNAPEVDGDPYTLTTFGGVCIIFAAVSLTIGLSRFVVNWVTSFGN